MSEMKRVAGCILLDPAHRAVLQYRRAHDQWQLPGGVIEDGELAISAAAREVHEKLGVAATGLHKIGNISFEHGDVEYGCTLFQVTAMEGAIMNMQPHVYDEPERFNLFRKDLGRLSLSPLVEYVAEELVEGRMFLQPRYPVQ